MSMAGVDFLRAMLDKRLPAPPFAGLMQIDVTEIEPGRVTFTWVPDESMCNATGMIHGGIVCTLLDTVERRVLSPSGAVGKRFPQRVRRRGAVERYLQVSGCRSVDCGGELVAKQ